MIPVTKKVTLTTSPQSVFRVPMKRFHNVTFRSGADGVGMGQAEAAQTDMIPINNGEVQAYTWQDFRYAEETEEYLEFFAAGAAGGETLYVYGWLK